MTSTRFSIRTEAIAIVLLALATASPAVAQNTGALAESLFRDGKALMAKGDYEHACPKFEESMRMEASSGSALALGVCYAGAGKTASAWGAYVNAASLARRDNRKDREQAALARAAELEPKLSRVTIDVGPETRGLAGLEVKQDDLTIGSAAWQNAPVDPGRHSLTVSATHKKTYTATFEVKGEGTKQTIAIPPLEDEPVAPPPVGTDTPPTKQPPSARPYPPPPQGSTLRSTGFIVAGAGAAALVTGGVFGVIALQKINDVKKKCPSSPCADASAVSDDHTAGTFADVSTVAMSVGAVGLAVGTIFVLVSPKREEAASTSVHPIVGLGTIGLGGSF